MTKNGLVLIGGGGHCISVIDSLEHGAGYDNCVITDSIVSAGTYLLGIPVVGADEMLDALFEDGFINAFITVGGIGTTRSRRLIANNIERIGYNLINIIDASAYISNRAILGEGIFVGKKAVVNAKSTISDYAIINTGVIIEHECKIGNFCHIAVGAVICGGCDIGENAFVGANATVIQGVKVGMNSIIGAGSIVLADVPENATIVGVWRGIA